MPYRVNRPVNYRLEMLAVIHLGGITSKISDHLVFDRYRIAKEICAVLPDPSGIGVFLPPFGHLHAGCIAWVPAPGRINDLATSGAEPFLEQLRPDSIKQNLGTRFIDAVFKVKDGCWSEVLIA